MWIFERPGRGAGYVGARLLLLVALLLGLGAMHTLGHLQHETYTAVQAPLSFPVPATDGPSMSGPIAIDAHHTGELPELDPTSFCLTLGAFTVLLLGVAAVAFHRWPGAPTVSAAPTPRPLPPGSPLPDEPSTALLQVLRV